jgi:hypothetical protein
LLSLSAAAHAVVYAAVLQAPGQQAYNYEQRLKYGRFFYRFPDGESAADVYDRMTM